MASTFTVFKILDTASGLYSLGGLLPAWNAEGKTWRTRGQVAAHLKLYSRGAFAQERNKIPDTWTVVEYKLTPVKRVRASSLV